MLKRWPEVLVTGSRRTQELEVWNAAADILDALPDGEWLGSSELMERLWPELEVRTATDMKLRSRMFSIIAKLRAEAPSYYTQGELFKRFGHDAHRAQWHKGNRMELAQRRAPEGKNLLARVAALEARCEDLEKRLEALEPVL